MAASSPYQAFAMPLRPFIACLATALLLATSTVSAGSLDDDLRQAAKLHKGGDTPAAMAIWQRWASQGNVDAAYNLAVIHQHADGVPLDYATALRWYRVAAEKGDKVSQFQIGLMYQIGQGVEANAEEAHRWFTAHLKHHLHHEHDPKMQAWRKQAAALIDERDRREALAANRRDAAHVLADLKFRAGLLPERPLTTAATSVQP